MALGMMETRTASRLSCVLFGPPVWSNEEDFSSQRVESACQGVCQGGSHQYEQVGGINDGWPNDGKDHAGPGCHCHCCF